MTPVARHIGKDLVHRGGWLLAASVLAQFLFALGYFGILNWVTGISSLFIVVTAILPVFAPGRRAMQVLAMRRAEVDAMMWLFGGGLIALTATCANILAFAIAALTHGGGFDPLHTATLLIGAPGAFGLGMTLRRWTLTGTDPNSQIRPVLLLNLFYLPLVTISDVLSTSMNVWSLLWIGVLSLGCVPLALFWISPEFYYRWCDTRSSLADTPSKRSTRRRFRWPQTFKGTLFLCAGAIFLAWFQSSTGSRASVAFSIAMMATVFGLIQIPAVKVLRSIPWSVGRCAAIMMAVSLAPAVASLSTYIGSCNAFACATVPAYGAIVPIVAAIAPLIAITIRLSLSGALPRSRWLALYMLMVFLGGLVGTSLGELLGRYLFVANAIGVATLAATYVWIRYELRHRVLLYRQPHAESNLWMSS